MSFYLIQNDYFVLIFQVSVLFSRDLDSRLGPRESSAAQEFLSSDASAFHVMRDHREHRIPVMGGTWGVKLDGEGARGKMARSFKAMFRVRECCFF